MFPHLLLLLVGFVLLRVLYLIVVIRNNSKRDVSHITGKRKGPTRTMIVMGSGGHTAEMLQIVQQLDFAKYAPRHYVLAAADKTSVVKVIDVEVRRQPDIAKQEYEILTITRSRHVQQSYLTSVFTTLTAIANSVPLVLRSRPDLILTNGPGTCVPICLVAFLAKVLFINRNCKIVFVESFCRVKSLSLSGRILLWITDLFVVQWPGLASEGITRKVQYFGRLSE